MVTDMTIWDDIKFWHNFWKANGGDSCPDPYVMMDDIEYCIIANLIEYNQSDERGPYGVLSTTENYIIKVLFSNKSEWLIMNMTYNLKWVWTTSPITETFELVCKSFEYGGITESDAEHLLMLYKLTV